MTIPATVYHRPNGRREEIEVPEVNPEDETYIKENNVVISMEELNIGGIAIYFDYGAQLEDGTPNEWIEVSGSRSCKDTIAAGIVHIKQVKEVTHG